MLELIGTQGYEPISKPCADALEVFRRVTLDKDAPTAAEIGVGIGATTVELVRMMKGRGTLHLFDYSERVNALSAELARQNFAQGVKIVPHGNGNETFASYAWQLAIMHQQLREQHAHITIFDFIYFDGAHAFHHDAPACAAAKEMIRPGGYIVFDDMHWTFNKSPTMNPSKNPEIRKHYSPEQLSRSHVELVVDLLMRSDSRYEQVLLNHNRHPHRSVFRRKMSM